MKEMSVISSAMKAWTFFHISLTKTAQRSLGQGMSWYPLTIGV